MGVPVLEALATAVPGEPVPQRAVRETAADILTTLAPELTRHLSVFDNANIDTRHFVRPIDWYLETRGWGEVSRVYQEEGVALLERAATDALAEANLTADAVDGIVLVSTTGVSTPSLDARLLNRMPFRRDIQRVPIWGLGCAGGVGGLNLTADLARANPDKRYLFLSLELCSLAFHMTDLSVRAFVATTLFSDGCAAAIVRGDALEGARLGDIRPGLTHSWKDTEDVMGWTMEDEGLFVVFSRRIPDIVRERLAPLVSEYVKREGGGGSSGSSSGGSVDRHVFHPGGTKVIESYEEALRPPEGAFDDTREVLRRYGNMSSPTVLFALRDSLRRRPLASGERALLAALGPGFAADLGMVVG